MGVDYFHFPLFTCCIGWFGVSDISLHSCMSFLPFFMELINIILLCSSHICSGILKWALCEITVHLDCTVSGQLIYHMFMCFPFECYELWKNYSYWQEDILFIGFAENSWYYVIVYCSICRNDALNLENQSLFSYLDMLFARCFMLQSAA